MVPHFSVIDLKMKFLNMLSSHTVNLSIKLLSILFSGIIQLVSRLIATIFRRQKFLRLFLLVWVFYCLILEFCWLQSCHYANNDNCSGIIGACGTPTFFCARQKPIPKTFSIPGIACVKTLGL